MRKPLSAFAVHAILGLYTLLALFPIVLVVMNSFKARRAIFNTPLHPPSPANFDPVGYARVFGDSSLAFYYLNSITVTAGAIILTLLFGAMAAWALTEYKFRWNTLLALFLSIGIMVPIRLGSVAIIQLVAELNLINTLTALILVYTAQNLPLAIFILSEFIAQIPKDLREAARCDGLSEYNIFFHVILPLIRPAMATVAVFTMIPVWNDLWFPLLLAPAGGRQTITLGVQQFLGQYITDWNAVLAALSTAIVPVLLLYVIFSRQLIRGLTSGAVK
ncbi:carbohydrate ABC transporter permease [Aestuariivirga sp.]|uniref:carbohydrate ABC transporter permease n=1 Tax=Aestuariivirga sp. TaxID=2650926 RepID=UPI0025C0768F|nr:carbohydrate ABC transporter permease [Aestuariivirga sp.]MCA3555459.1 carbohydrate ABC transporter permease [Aestuariivirga sp.]